MNKNKLQITLLTLELSCAFNFELVPTQYDLISFVFAGSLARVIIRSCTATDLELELSFSTQRHLSMRYVKIIFHRVRCDNFY